MKSVFQVLLQIRKTTIEWGEAQLYCYKVPLSVILEGNL